MWPWQKETDMSNESKDNKANREKQATWRNRHREENRERVYSCLENNPGYLQEWRDRNPDKVREYSQRQNDSEDRKAYMREYMKEYRKSHKTEPTGKKVGRPRKSES